MHTRTLWSTKKRQRRFMTPRLRTAFSTLVIESFFSILDWWFSQKNSKPIGLDHSPSPKYFLMEPLSYLNPIVLTLRWMVIGWSISLEVTYHPCLSWISKLSLRTIEFEDRVRLVTWWTKTLASHGWQPMFLTSLYFLIKWQEGGNRFCILCFVVVVYVQDFPRSVKTFVLVFCLYSTRVSFFVAQEVWYPKSY
jgi:hypothetical protein